MAIQILAHTKTHKPLSLTFIWDQSNTDFVFVQRAYPFFAIKCPVMDRQM